MLKALNRANVLVLSLKCTESDGPFFCPKCKEELVFKDGLLRIPHFSHHPNSQCNYAGESEAHLYAKVQIWDGLRRDPACTEVDYERQVGNRRPDVWSIINGYQVAVEVQRSEKTIDDVRQKLRDYYSMGVYCIYVSPRSAPAGDYSAKAWERYLHAMAYGNLYYFFQKHQIAIIHLGAYKYTAGQVRNEEFYLQARPVISYLFRVPLTKFEPVFHNYEDMNFRHIGITDALMWNFPKRNWWTLNLFEEAL